MTISCAIECDGAAWWWSANMRLLPYDKKKGKRCCSCGDMVRRGAKYIQVERWRDCANDIEERIYGDEVPLAFWVVCESCAPICQTAPVIGQFSAKIGVWIVRP